MGFNLKEFRDRILPVVGEQFFEKVVTVYDLNFAYLQAEALARTGVKKSYWIDSNFCDRNIQQSFGLELEGKTTQEGLNYILEEKQIPSGEIESRNHYDWLSPLQVSDIFIGKGDEEAGDIAQRCVEDGVPFVITFFPKYLPMAVHIIWHSGLSSQVAVRACRVFSELSQINLEGHHLELLDAASVSLNIAKKLLMGEKFPNPILVRKSNSFPWAVKSFSDIDEFSQKAGMLIESKREHLRTELLKKEKLMVIGLGTSSLFCTEAVHYFSDMMLVDRKEVSIYNPIRQAYGLQDVGKDKAETLYNLLKERNPQTKVQYRNLSIDGENLAELEKLINEYSPTVVVVAMGKTRDENFYVTDMLREKGIRHLVPSAFPGVSHYKYILVDGSKGPCYSCIQGRLIAEAGPGVELTEEQREMFYGGTQPATLAETYPSAHGLLRLSILLALPEGARPAWFRRFLKQDRTCFIGANKAEQREDGWLYGVPKDFMMVVFGPESLIPEDDGSDCGCGWPSG